HDVRGPVQLDDVVNGHDVGVGQTSGGRRLLIDAPPQIGVLLRRKPEITADRLDGDQAVELGIAGLVDDPHGAAPELRPDHIATSPVRGRLGHPGSVSSCAGIAPLRSDPSVWESLSRGPARPGRLWEEVARSPTWEPRRADRPAWASRI